MANSRPTASGMPVPAANSATSSAAIVIEDSGSAVGVASDSEE